MFFQACRTHARKQHYEFSIVLLEGKIKQRPRGAFLVMYLVFLNGVFLHCVNVFRLSTSQPAKEIESLLQLCLSLYFQVRPGI